MKKYLLIAFAFTALFSCNKEPGYGGQAIIKGQIWVESWNAEFTEKKGEYFGTDRDVYIIHGDGNAPDDRVKSGPDGTFQFAYLLPGKYQIYVYSEDSTLQSPDGMIAIMQEVEIMEKDQIVDLSQLTVFD